MSTNAKSEPPVRKTGASGQVGDKPRPEQGRDRGGSGQRGGQREENRFDNPASRDNEEASAGRENPARSAKDETPSPQHKPGKAKGR